jgi:riboflavin kinase/FMN adenylyltransferase
MGHRDLFSYARQVADKNDMDLTILTFTPHPRRVFQPNIAPFRLTENAVKSNIITTDIQPDHYVVLDFTDQLRALTATDFIDEILLTRCNAGIVIVGQDFRFGYERQGDIAMLKACNDFETIGYDLLEIDGVPISSTRIRNHLKNAEIFQANALLGAEWFLQGEVVHGDKRGRELGYPTANMHFGETIVPAHGIYAVKIMIEGENAYRFGAANIGIRPMFETRLPMCETYIFDFDQDIYGRILQIYPVQKIRDEMKFDDLEALKDQMKDDCIIAKNILQNAK